MNQLIPESANSLHAELRTLIASSRQRLAGPKIWPSFESRKLRRMVKFAESIPDAAIVTTLSTQLRWSHMVIIKARKAPQALQQRPGGYLGGATQRRPRACSRRVQLPNLGSMTIT